MKKMYKDKYLEYQSKGYCIIKNCFDETILENSFNDIIESKKTSIYSDRLGKLRRIESIYDISDNMKQIHEKCLEILFNVFSKDFIIFKDKYNAKPPGGEGFYAHYDGVFNWIDSDGKSRNGWYEYSNTFVNVLLAIDPMNENNGALEISDEHKGSYFELLKNTKNNNTPDLKKTVEDNIKFEKILINAGDLVLFSNACPHRSSRNNSNLDRRSIYYTFNPKDEGDNYKQYFLDKEKSKNTSSKSLSGEI
jgi:ectoine hydroxylase-related dioxygenase (phytanoyl-CoA dioxygenase family)